MKSFYSLAALLATFSIFFSCQPKAMNPLETIMSSDAPQIKAISESLPDHEVQILYTRIKRDENGVPIFEEYSYQLNDNQYFYPASTAKLPVAILALQRINELQAQGIQIDEHSSIVITDPIHQEIILDRDSTSENGLPSISHLIKKIFLVSDNDAYNYLFDFLGRDYINEQLEKKGMEPAHINHKFLYGADNQNTWQFKFFNDEGELVYKQGSLSSEVPRHNYDLTGMIKGVGYTDNDGNLYNDPFDFSEKNYFSLRSLNQILTAIIFPESLESNQRFDLTETQYNFVRFWMSRNTLESEYPNYDYDNYYESYVKFFMFGDDQSPMPKNIRIYNKVGDAYGTLTDVAYIIDSENEIEFMLAATVHVNENGIFNDGVYEYDDLGFPFMAELGRKVYQYELEQKD